MDRLSAILLVLVAVATAYFAFAAYFVWDIINKGTYLFEPSPIFTERLNIVYVSTNQTSRMIYSIIQNTGVITLNLTQVTVNGTVITTGDALPISLKPREWYNYSFRYDGPWTSINVVFHSSTGMQYPKSVDLQAVSKP